MENTTETKILGSGFKVIEGNGIRGPFKESLLMAIKGNPQFSTPIGYYPYDGDHRKGIPNDASTSSNVSCSS